MSGLPEDCSANGDPKRQNVLPCVKRAVKTPFSGYRTKRVGFMVTFRLFDAEKSVLKLVGANLKDGLNVLVL